jgi:HSP20 family molecular chaperone IbpA
LSNKVDQDKISTDLSDGARGVRLPKAEAVKPRKVAVK